MYLSFIFYYLILPIYCFVINNITHLSIYYTFIFYLFIFVT